MSDREENRPPDILLFLGHPTANHGGLEIAAFNITSRLARLGHAVTAFFNHDGDLLASYRSFCRSALVLTTPVAAVRAFVALAFRRRAGARAVVYGHHAARLFHLALAGAVARAPVVCHLHLPPQKLRAFYRLGIRRTDLFIAVSRATADAWILEFRIPPEKVIVVHNGVDVDRFLPAADPGSAKTRLGLEPGRTIVSYLGRLDRQKGVHVLIAAFGAYLAAHPSADACLIVGGAPTLDEAAYADELHALAARSAPVGRIRFVGRVADPVGFIQASDLTVVPSVWDEPFALTIVESMSCGVPVLASRIGGIPEVMSDFPDLMFTPGDVNELSDRIGATLGWRAAQSGLGRQFRQAAERRFSLDACAANVSRALRSVGDGAIH